MLGKLLCRFTSAAVLRWQGTEHAWFDANKSQWPLSLKSASVSTLKQIFWGNWLCPFVSCFFFLICQDTDSSWSHLGSGTLGQTSQLVPTVAIVGLPQFPKLVPCEGLPQCKAVGSLFFLIKETFWKSVMLK